MQIKLTFTALFAAMLTLSAFGQSLGIKPSKIERIPLTIKLSDFDARAEMTLPADAEKPLPAVLLLHGSDVADMDYTMVDDQGKVSSRILRDVAEYLSARGFAVVRYNKRYVESFDKFDAERFQKLTLQDLLADAKTVLGIMRNNPDIDRNNIFVYGWSEGSAIAGQIAATDSNIKGVVFQGAVARPFSENLSGLFSRTGLPYLAQFARNGKVGGDELAAAQTGRGGIPAKMFARFLVDRSSAPGVPKIAAFMDKDGDGLIDLEREARPIIDGWFSDANLGTYSKAQALPGLISFASRLTVPILILQGANDGNTPKGGAEELDRALAANRDHTLKIYPGLGHSLGIAPTMLEDSFAPIANRPLQDMAGWLSVHNKKHQRKTKPAP